MRVNEVAPHITAFTATGMAHPAYHGRHFELIFANIMARPLIRLAADFDRHLAWDGRLILSGLMNGKRARSWRAIALWGLKLSGKK